MAKRFIDKVMEKIAGKPGVPSLQPVSQVAPNRRAQRAHWAMQQKLVAAPKRRKHEKRGAPGRRSKGRAPLSRHT